MDAKAKMKPLRELLLTHTRRGELWKTEPLGVRCFACGHRCLIYEGHDGICKVRSNVGGELRVPWGYVGGLQLDPIEKKPFFHVMPGAPALSFGMLGCDFHCAYCQNWITSQALRDPEATAGPELVSASEVVAMAKRSGAKVLTSTYNEPLITSEWAVEIFKRAKKEGLKTSYVSNGNGTPEVLEYIRPYVDYYKVDLKSFDDKHYRKLGGVLKNVTDTIERLFEMGFWLEIVTLVIPGFNDDPKELKEAAKFLASISPNIPWHITAFHQDYKMRDNGNTQVSSLIEAGEIGREAGLKFVYLGNRPGQVGDWENTYCPHCGEELIRRLGFKILSQRMNGAECSKCKKTVPGRWL